MYKQNTDSHNATDSGVAKARLTADLGLHEKLVYYKLTSTVDNGKGYRSCVHFRKHIDYVKLARASKI